MSKHSYLGKVYPTKSFGNCTVVDYKDSSNVLVRFENTGNEVYVAGGNLRSGRIRDPMAPGVAGVGFLGTGKYQCRNKTSDGMRTKEYACWESMMKRVYNPQNASAARPYEDTSVDVRWHNFQIFAEWCQTQKGFGEQGFQLDKDLISKGNKVYSPEKCCFIPLHINTAITGMKHNNTSGYAGVSETSVGTYGAEVTINSVHVHLGTYNSKESAAFVYRSIKEAYVRSLAEVYKDSLAENTYSALKIWTTL